MPAESRSRQTIRGAKNQVRGAKTKSGRRGPVRSSTDVPVMAIVVGGILLALFAGLVIYGAINSRTSTVPAVHGSTGDIPCDALEHTQVHYHAALQIIYLGTQTHIPAGIGIQGGEASPSCYYWLHVHQSSKDVIHIESPASRTFTLGDFFKVWDAFNTYNGQPHEKLDSTHVSTLTLTPGQQVVIYVDLGDGKGAQVYAGDPNSIILKSHEVITIEITPPPVNPPPGYTFANGL